MSRTARSIKRAMKDKQEERSAAAQIAEFLRKEMRHMRADRHGAWDQD